MHEIITLTLNGILQVDLLQKLASQFKPVQMAFRKQPVTKPLIMCSGWKLCILEPRKIQSLHIL